MCNPVQEVKNLGESVVEGVKDVGSFVDDKILQPIKEDPVEAIATAVGYYYGGAPGAALARGGTKLAQGEDPEDAAKAAALTYVTASAGEALGGGTTGGETGAYDMGQGLDVMSGGSGQVAGTAGATAAPTVDATAGSTPAPIVDATVVTPEQTYPGVEKGAFTPAPGSLQATLPELGVQTAASAPYTAIPGSIEAMLAGTPIAGANPAISVQDAFRGARMIQGLLNKPQSPQVNPYQLMQQQGPGSVSYEELLGLLNRPRATTLSAYQPQQQSPYSLI
jgi:hypothetical protein